MVAELFSHRTRPFPDFQSSSSLYCLSPRPPSLTWNRNSIASHSPRMWKPAPRLGSTDFSPPCAPLLTRKCTSHHNFKLKAMHQLPWPWRRSLGLPSIFWGLNCEVRNAKPSDFTPVFSHHCIDALLPRFPFYPVRSLSSKDGRKSLLKRGKQPCPARLSSANLSSSFLQWNRGGILKMTGSLSLWTCKIATSSHSGRRERAEGRDVKCWTVLYKICYKKTSDEEHFN